MVKEFDASGYWTMLEYGVYLRDKWIRASNARSRMPNPSPGIDKLVSSSRIEFRHLLEYISDKFNMDIDRVDADIKAEWERQ